MFLSRPDLFQFYSVQSHFFLLLSNYFFQSLLLILQLSLLLLILYQFLLILSLGLIMQFFQLLYLLLLFFQILLTHDQFHISLFPFPFHSVNVLFQISNLNLILNEQIMLLIYFFFQIHFLFLQNLILLFQITQFLHKILLPILLMTVFLKLLKGFLLLFRDSNYSFFLSL